MILIRLGRYACVPTYQCIENQRPPSLTNKTHKANKCRLGLMIFNKKQDSQ